MHFPIHNDHVNSIKVSWDYLPSACGSTLHGTDKNKPVLIVGPYWIQTILNDTSTIDKFSYRFVDAQDLTTNEHPLQEYFLNELGFSNIIAVPMLHSYPTYGVVITSKLWKFSYSADSRPWQQFIDAGKNSTMLVHECTFDDAVSERAKKTSHSTVSEAIGVALSMSASFIVFTHFSTRFSRASFPDISSKYFDQNTALSEMKGRIIPAFDFMCLPLDKDKLASISTTIPKLDELDLD